MVSWFEYLSVFNNTLKAVFKKLSVLIAAIYKPVVQAVVGNSLSISLI
jgi:hypothetical protein